MRKYLCGTPQEHCIGSAFGTSARLGGKRSYKMHPDSPEAFKCYRRYLIKELHYEPIGSRELKAPNGPVLVLAKQSRFGAELRRGKEGGRAQPRHGLRGVIY